jgi:hypothetical protein
MTTYSVEINNNSLIPSKGPNMQVPPQTYDPVQQGNLVNQLKLYHNRLDSNGQQLIVRALSSSVLQWIS